MDTDNDLQRGFKQTVNLCWGMIAALMLCPLAVEIIRLADRSFAGYEAALASRVKDYVYGLAIVLPLGIRNLRKAIWKRSPTTNLEALVRKLRRVTTATVLVAAMPALLGFGLFLLGGLYKEFYVALGYSCLVIFIYFPRYLHWQTWAKSTSRFF